MLSIVKKLVLLVFGSFVLLKGMLGVQVEAMSLSHSATFAQSMLQENQKVELYDKSIRSELTRWIVVLADPRSERRQNFRSGVGYQAPRNYDSDPILGRLARSISDKYQLNLEAQWPIMSLNVHCLVVTIKPGNEAVLDSLSNDHRVRWVQPYNQFKGATSQLRNSHSSNEIKLNKFENKVSTLFSDPYFQLQKTFQQLHLEPVVEQLDGRGVSVVVVDSGISFSHPDLKQANIRHRDFVDLGSNEESLKNNDLLETHGTAVASIIVAQRNNQEGIAGIAPAILLHGFRSCWQESSSDTLCNSLTLSRALDQAIRLKPDIVNLSLTGPPDRLLSSLLSALLNQGAIIVTAYDRQRQQDRFPEPQPGVFIAGDPSVDTFNNRNVIPLPGEKILTASPGSGYDFRSGHSLSAAHLTAVLALIKQKYKQDDFQELFLNYKNNDFFFNVHQFLCQQKKMSCLTKK